jgi:uroporphyrinogen-III synthase
VARQPLAGCGVAVTRPAHQADGLCAALAAAGATALRFPTIEIHPLKPPDLTGRDYDLIVYTSVNAVEHAGPLLRLRAPIMEAVGAATSNALIERDMISEQLIISKGGSEGVLERFGGHDDPPRGKRILIITGRDGRKLLREVWSASGNFVQTVEVYERIMPAADPAPLEDAWRRGALHAVTVTSNETLKNLDRMLTPFGRERLRDAQLVVASVRAVRLAHELGIRPYPLVAEGPDSAALVEALTFWWAQAGPRSPDGR